MTPSWRKPVGMIGILVYITLWVVLVVSFSRIIGMLPGLAQAPIYLVAGIVWILPLRPALLWMETGRWRVPR
ncbi:DUF2842 domain-containing protein [Sphingomonas sp. RS2018]